MGVTVSGIQAAQAALDSAINGVNVESEAMLNVMLQAISAATAPYVPIDTAALINSERRKTWMTPSGPQAEIGYGAEGAFSSAKSWGSGIGTPVQEYAVYVHEGPQKNWQRPGASNRYLEHGVNDFIRDDLSNIIRAFS